MSRTLPCRNTRNRSSQQEEELVRQFTAVAMGRHEVLVLANTDLNCFSKVSHWASWCIAQQWLACVLHACKLFIFNFFYLANVWQL